MKTIKQLVKELNILVKQQTLSIYKKLQEIKKAYIKKYKKNPTFADISKITQGVMDHAQVSYYMRLEYMLPETKKAISPSLFCQINKANSCFTYPEYQAELVKVVKAKKFNREQFRRNGSSYLKELFPKLETEFDKVQALMNTIYKLRQFKDGLDYNYTKLSSFHKLKLWHEWSYLKKEIDKKIVKVNGKRLWTVEASSKTGFLRMKKLLNGDLVPNKLSIKVQQGELLNKIHLLHKFHCKVY